MDSHVSKSSSRKGQRPGSILTRLCLSRNRKPGVKTWRFTFPAGPRLGNVVIEADGVSKAYGANLLVEDMTFQLPRADLWG